MEELIIYILKHALNIDKFKIETKNPEENYFIYTIKVPDESIGLVIGKMGKTIKAIRNIQKIKATLENTHVNIEVSSL